MDEKEAEARPVMGTIFLVGERSEPLSMVFNDQPRDIYIFITYLPRSLYIFQ